MRKLSLIRHWPPTRARAAGGKPTCPLACANSRRHCPKRLFGAKKFARLKSTCPPTTFRPCGAGTDAAAHAVVDRHHALSPRPRYCAQSSSAPVMRESLRERRSTLVTQYNYGSEFGFSNHGYVMGSAVWSRMTARTIVFTLTVLEPNVPGDHLGPAIELVYGQEARLYFLHCLFVQ